MNHFNKKMAVVLALILICEIGYSQTKGWPQTFLWRISGNGLSNPSYLYGTIHLSDKRLFYFGDSLYRCLEKAEGFHTELDADTLINASMRKWAQNNNGRLLKTLMDKKEYAKYADKLTKTLGKPADRITTKDVWLAKNRKSAEAYKKGDMQNFMDLYLYGIAKKQGKKVGGIEDLEDQMNIMDDVFNEMDVAYVTSDTLQAAGMSMVESMKEIYLRQDLNAIEALTSNSINPKFRDLILTRRNLKMAFRMDSLARQRSSFFAVGVAHLPGDTGVINMLRKRGFTVEPIFSSKKVTPGNYTYRTVDVQWLNYKHDLNLYQAEAPGALQPIDVMKEVMDMEYYYEVATGKVYYTAVINSVADNNKKDSVFNVMIGRMSTEGRTLVSKKNIVKQNYDGRDVIIKTAENQLLHLNVYMAEGYAYMAMVLSKKSELNDKDSKRFFDSFTMTPTSSIARPYQLFTDTALAFSIKLPQDPAINERNDAEDGSDDIKVFSASDFSSGNSYSVTVRNTKAGNYIPSDSSYLAQIKTNIAALMKNDTVSENFLFKGYPALRMRGSSKTDNVYFRNLTVLRGNRSYFLFSQTKERSSNTLTDSFFHSFSLMDYPMSEWKDQHSAGNLFSGWFPAPVIEKVNDSSVLDISANLSDSSAFFSGNQKEKLETDFLFFDKSTSTSYNVQREEFPQYFSGINDSTFFTEASVRFKSEGDSLTGFTLLHVGKDKAADMQIVNANSSVIKKLRFILHGDTLYKVFTYTSPWLANNANTKMFFNRFSITSTASATTLFNNKVNTFVADLSSADSTVFHQASEYLYSASLRKGDLHSFYPLLIKPLRDFKQGSYNTNNQLVESVAEIADSSTVNFVLQQYHTLTPEQRPLQYSLLKLLVKMKQPFATESVIKLFNASAAPAGNIGIFASALRNNLPLAKTLFPVIMALTKDTTAALEYAYLITVLLDSNYISKNEVLPYLDHFITAAAGQKIKMKANADDYDYNLNSVLDLFGIVNSEISNTRLDEYSKINNLEISYQAFTWLIKNDRPLHADVINKLASSDEFRTELYDTLQRVNKTALFPAAHLNQRSFAAGYLYGYAKEDDSEPDVIKYLNEKIVNFRGKKLKFHLFRVTFGEGADATHSLGVAGPFLLSGSQPTSTNEATGIYWKEDFSARDINAQFAEYLKQLETEEE